MCLSRKEREFIKDSLAMFESIDKVEEFRSKYSSSYVRVLKHRVLKKYYRMKLDLELIEKFLEIPRGIL